VPLTLVSCESCGPRVRTFKHVFFSRRTTIDSDLRTGASPPRRAMEAWTGYATAYTRALSRTPIHRDQLLSSLASLDSCSKKLVPRVAPEMGLTVLIDDADLECFRLAAKSGRTEREALCSSPTHINGNGSISFRSAWINVRGIDESFRSITLEPSR